MSDTIFEEYRKGGIGQTQRNVNVHFGRFWMGSQDGIQISIEDHYVQLSITEFREIVQAIEQNVDENKDAWWVKLSKEKGDNQQ